MSHNDLVRLLVIFPSYETDIKSPCPNSMGIGMRTHAWYKLNVVSLSVFGNSPSLFGTGSSLGQPDTRIDGSCRSVPQM